MPRGGQGGSAAGGIGNGRARIYPTAGRARYIMWVKRSAVSRRRSVRTPAECRCSDTIILYLPRTPNYTTRPRLCACGAPNMCRVPISPESRRCPRAATRRRRGGSTDLLLQSLFPPRPATSAGAALSCTRATINHARIYTRDCVHFHVLLQYNRICNCNNNYTKRHRLCHWREKDDFPAVPLLRPERQTPRARFNALCTTQCTFISFPSGTNHRIVIRNRNTSTRCSYQRQRAQKGARG